MPDPRTLRIVPARQVQNIEDGEDSNEGSNERDDDRDRRPMKGEKLPNYIIAILALAGAAVVLSCFTFIIVLVSIEILKQ